MNDDFAKRVRSAAIAGWWTVLIAAIFLTLQWFAFLSMMRHKPAWVLELWGSDMQWATIQTVGLWLTGVLKLCIWIAAMIALWLTLWARRLRQG